jgi:hypothetical protein
MLLRRRRQRSEADKEYLIRCGRLKSEIEQSKTHAYDPQLDLLQQYMDTLEGERPTTNDLLTVQIVEAELCLFKPLSLLYPTYVRLQDLLYRFEQTRRDAWRADLKRLIPDGETINLEPVLRQRLRQLTYEVNEAAERYNRINQQRSDVVRSLNICGITIVMLMIFLFLFTIKI